MLELCVSEPIRNKGMPFYRVIGKIHTMDGKKHVVTRRFTSIFATYHTRESEIISDALHALERRKDKGAPWYGDAITIVDEETYGRKYKVYVNVLYPEWYGQ